MSKSTHQIPEDHKDNTDRSKYRAKYIPVANVIEYVERGLSYTEIAKIIGCDVSAVSRKMRRHGFLASSLQAFKNRRADIFALVSAQILDSITDEDIRQATLLQKMTAVGILYDKERLARDQSTHNISVSSTIDAIHREMDALNKEAEEIRGGEGRKTKK